MERTSPKEFPYLHSIKDNGFVKGNIIVIQLNGEMCLDAYKATLIYNTKHV